MMCSNNVIIMQITTVCHCKLKFQLLNMFSPSLVMFQTFATFELLSNLELIFVALLTLFVSS